MTFINNAFNIAFMVTFRVVPSLSGSQVPENRIRWPLIWFSDGYNNVELGLGQKESIGFKETPLLNLQKDLWMKMI